MSLSRRIVFRWLPLAAVATAACLLVYLAVQQVWRHGANDPQIQMARDIASALATGQAPESAVPPAQVDYGMSLAPFVMVFNDAGVIVASSGALHGQRRTLPAGVFDHARQSGEERVSWQPQAGVRIAAVVVHYPGSPGGFVMAGRSLEESEARTAQFGELVELAWVAMLVGLLVLAAASEYGASRSRFRVPSS